MKIGILFLSAALVLAGCGGGGSSNNAAPSAVMPNPSPGTGAQTPQAARDAATTAGQNLGSVTQSSNVNGDTQTTLDRVRAKLDASGNPMFDERGDIVVENTHQNWESSNNEGHWQELGENAGGSTKGVTAYEGGSCSGGPSGGGCVAPPSVQCPAGEVCETPTQINGTPVIDATGLTLKSPSDYQSGDYYLVTGLWYEDDTNFGYFADGPELTDALPTSGSATYEGGANGIYWDRRRIILGAQEFSADVEFNAVVSGDNVQISGRASNIMSHDISANALVPILENREIVFKEMTYTNPGITNGAVDCEPGCSVAGGSWGGQFHGNPPAGNETNGWPFSFNGTFGIQGLTYDGDLYDALGNFSTIHGDLDDLHTCLTDAGFFHGILSNGASCFN